MEPWFVLIKDGKLGGLWCELDCINNEFQQFKKYSVGPFPNFTEAKKYAIKYFPQWAKVLKGKRKWFTRTYFVSPTKRFLGMEDEPLRIDDEFHPENCQQ